MTDTVEYHFTVIPSGDPSDHRTVTGLPCPDCGRSTLTRKWFGLAVVSGVGRRSVLIDSCPCDARGDTL